MYRITVDKEFIKYPQLWGSIIKEGTSMLVNDDFIDNKVAPHPLYKNIGSMCQ